jgi:hypothetical protein
MMDKIKILIVLLTLTACKQKSTEISIKQHFSDDTSKINSISVFSGEKKIQEVKVENEFAENAELIDWNFDGFKDLSVKCSAGSGGQPYDIWMYSKKNKKFVFNKEISGRYLLIDSINKRIVFYRRDGYEFVFWDTMKFEKDKLIFDRGTAITQWIDSNDNIWKKTHSVKFRNGKYTSKIDSSIIK